MIYTILLAGGSGKRMGNTTVPKQFIEIRGIPIIIRTLKKLRRQERLDKIVVLCNMDYCALLDDMLVKYGMTESVYILPAAASRYESLAAGIDYIKENFAPSENDFVMIHDAVRPFTDDEVLSGAINRTRLHSAVVVANPLTVDVVEIDENNCIGRTISRKHLYTDEAPQLFNINLLTKFAKKYSAEELAGITDLATLFVDNGEKVYVMEGNADNIKITTDKDIAIAQRLALGEEE